MNLDRGVRMIRARLTVRRGPRTALTAATGVVAFAALTAACSSAASSGSAPAPTGTAASQLSATGTPGAATSAGTGKLTGAAATALVTKAIANTQAATSVRVAGRATATGSATGSSGSQPVTFDLTLVKNVGCEGTLALTKAETFQLVETGGYVWILPSSAYYQSLHKAALALMADKYIKVKSTDKQIGDLGRECTFSGLLGSLSKPTGKNYTAVPVTYNGAPTYEVTQSGQQGTAFVANTATPLLLKITDPQKNGGTITFTSYNATKTITAPAAAESIDGSQLGI
jgi:hypothetical protein